MAKKKQNKKTESNSFVKFICSSQFRATIGIILIFISIFMTMSFISYFSTGSEDQSYIYATSQERKNLDLETVNWTGPIGALTAENIINNGIGIAALALGFFIAIVGLIMLNIKIKSVIKCLIYPLLIMVWVPVFLDLCFAKITTNLFFKIGGVYGAWMSTFLSENTGPIGEILILTATFIIFGIFAFGWHRYISNITLSMPNIPFIHNKEQEDLHSNSKEDDIAITDEENEKKIEENNIADSETEEPIDVSIIETMPADNDENIVQIEPIDSVADNNNNEGPTIIEDINDTDNLLDKLGPYDPTKDLSMYQFPSPELLKDFSNQTGGVSPEEQLKNQQKIITTLKHFNIGVKKIVETIGPTVTLFEIIPDDGVRVARIKTLEKDIMLSLAATGIRLIAPMPGKGTIGIEVPNNQPRTVGMRQLILSKKFQESNAELPIVMGRTITNDVFTFDLAKTPHLIVAGATGQGKSVGLNAIITSLLYKKHPSQVKFVLIDPKQLEFSIYSAIERHYLAKLPEETEAVITDSKKVINTLEAVCKEMDNRYFLLSTARVRNIVEYNNKFIERKLNPAFGHRYLPYIVVIVDEFGDLISTEGKKIETPIQRITQKARAAGIHMILATQRPSVNVITGVIKANCPTRIAFRVISKIDSMTILDNAGADQLIGKGDMLYSKGDVPQRVQCAFVDTPEVENIVEHIRKQQSYPEAYELPEPDKNEEEGKNNQHQFSIMNCDKLFNEVAEYVVRNQNGSTSNIQRNFDIGFNRAGRLMDDLESAGIVGPARGSKPREVLIKNLEDLATLIQSLQ